MNNELTFKALELVVHQTFSFCINSSDGETYYVDYTPGLYEDESEWIVKDEDGCDVEEDTELYQSIINFCKLIV